MAVYDFKEIEKKWIPKHDCFDGYKGLDFEATKKKFYMLTEFPYPSGVGLHVGHAFSMTLADIYARYKRITGYNVLFPMGWDAFGLPAENYAIKTGIKPQETTREVTGAYKKQMRRLGFSFDWDREINTTLPEYYRWTQWIFLKLFEKGLAEKKEMPINWCPKDKTGLANEEVIDGKCERCGTETEKRTISQWVLKITEYADKLIDGLNATDFIEKIKAAQINWIGKKEGAKIRFKIKGGGRSLDSARDDDSVRGDNGGEIEVFTTRPDTIFGSTFLVIAPEHPLVQKIVSINEIATPPKVARNNDIVAYLEKSKKKDEFERLDISKEKTGVFTGLFAINPLTKKEIPIWIADYVLMGYGTGAIMAVPAHDERDFEFARRFDLDILPVVLPQRMYVDENAKSYYTKRHNENWKMLKHLSELATQNKKTLMVGGGWGAAMNVGCEYRENEDIDMAILSEEKEWWVKELVGIGLNVGPQLGQEKEADVWFQATRSLPEGKDTHIDIDVLIETDEYKEASYKGCKFWVRKPELIINEKEEEIKSGKVGRWKEWSDFLMLKHKPYVETDGLLINSGIYNGLSSIESRVRIVEDLEKNDLAKKHTTFHLRDWIFSRQHYWGEPIPMVWCEKDGWVPVPEDQLPIVLPEVEKYQPTDNGESPLANISEWVNTKCPKCGGEAKRETDTMPNWAGSDWYFLRYTDPKNDKVFANKDLMSYWLPVDLYIGGDEHTTLHLLYSRFIYQVLWDLGIVPKENVEPYKKRLSHGVILGPDGNRMSKSKGNVIVPDAVADVYGTDVLRTYMMFMGPFDATMVWNERSLVGVRRFVEKLYKYVSENAGKYAVTDAESMKIIHKLIKASGEDLEQFKFNTVVARLMETMNDLSRRVSEVANTELGMIVKVFALFAPFAGEELWSMLGGEFSVHTQNWSAYEEKYLLSEVVNISVQVNGKLRGTIEISAEAVESEVIAEIRKNEKLLGYLNAGELKKTIYIKGRTINFVVG